MPLDLSTWMSHKHLKRIRLERIFCGRLLPTHVSSILVNGIAMIDPISQTEDLGALLDSSLLSWPTCSPPASPVDSPTSTLQSIHVPPLPLIPLQASLGNFHSLLTQLPASALDPDNPVSRMFFQIHKSEHTSPLQDLPMTSHCSWNETRTLESGLHSSVPPGPCRPLLRSSAAPAPEPCSPLRGLWLALLVIRISVTILCASSFTLWLLSTSDSEVFVSSPGVR